MTHGSLFSGIGGFDLAAEWMGWENVFHCEWNPFGQQVLKHHFPKSISYNDITKTDFSIHRGTIDILTGGFPCQPYSQAGKRKGKEDERHLWPSMLRAIREIQPSWVVGENVFGLINWSRGLVFHEVQTDLEAEGYEVFPYVLPAASVNAPHRRDRVWFVAYSKGVRWDGGKRQHGEKDNEDNRWLHECRQEWGEVGNITKRFSSESIITDTNNTRNTTFENRINGNESKEITEWQQSQFKHIGFSNTGDATHTDTTRIHEQFTTTKPNKTQQFSGGSFKRGNFTTFPTKSPICGGDDGLSRELDGITFSKWRNESIKAFGNAIVPQVAYQIFKSIQQYQDLQIV
jgi:DNA (cytosine-5)-methyltransferase 1